jgi:hypothetical protein
MHGGTTIKIIRKCELSIPMGYYSVKYEICYYDIPCCSYEALPAYAIE